MKKKYYLVVAMAFMSIFMLCACGKKTVLDYGDAASFEIALNAGENLEGKTVQFVATELHPDSVSGYNVWAGEHLNFVSSRNPDIKEGDIVAVRATEIESSMGSWFIKYEKIENAEIGDTTITSKDMPKEENTDDSNNSNVAYKSETVQVENLYEPEETTESSDEEASIEYISSDIVGFADYFGNPKVSAYVAIKNTGNCCIRFGDARIEYQDDNGNLLAVDSMPTCIPEAIKPGQTGYIYSYYYDISGLDLTNGLKFAPDAQIYAADKFYEIEISEPSFKAGSALDIAVTARGTNNTGRDESFAQLGAVFFDKDDNVVGFCYGFEDFANGQSKAFEISGDMMSEKYTADMVDHVEVYAQGNDW